MKQINNTVTGHYIKIFGSTSDNKITCEVFTAAGKLSRKVNYTSMLSIHDTILDGSYPDEVLQEVLQVLDLSVEWEISEDTQNWLVEECGIRLVIDNDLIARAKNEPSTGDQQLHALNNLFTSVRNERDGVGEWDGLQNPNIKIDVLPIYTVVYVAQIRDDNVNIIAPYTVENGTGEIKIEIKKI